ncbi:hypothetical protein T10_12900 [Trichinella papuae]|uniref:Peptidase aspartic putative domain-containing protein n=1 Tax=Trichinella papuae TaxID=268474 RepID=A0A0V1M5R0_9BILA|nr:hypothetical protein T10_12900 [Trichinella papuae]
MGRFKLYLHALKQKCKALSPAWRDFDGNMNMDMLLPSDHSRITNFAEDFVENHIEERRVETVKNGSDASVNVRLTRYELPKSHVNVLEFTALWEQFEDSIHSRLDISASTKSSYLRSCLSGPALAAGSDLSTTAANHPAAIEILKNRFSRKDVVIQNYIRKLLVLEPCIKPLADKLQQLHDQLYLHVPALGAVENDLSSTQITAAEFVMELFKQNRQSEKMGRRNFHGYIEEFRDFPQARFSKATRANAERLTTTAALGAKIEPRPNCCAICDGEHIFRLKSSVPKKDYAVNLVVMKCACWIQTEHVKILRLGDCFGQRRKLQQVKFCLKNVNHELENIPVDALCVPAIFRLSANLKNIELADTYPRTAVEIDVLMGMNFYYKLISNEIVKGKEKVPCVIKSQIRWILVGLIPSTTAEDKGTMLLSKFENECDCEVLQKFWSIDVTEIKDQAELLNKTASFLKKSTTCDGARYVVELPWINNQQFFPDNFAYALKRFQQIEKNHV